MSAAEYAETLANIYVNVLPQRDRIAAAKLRLETAEKRIKSVLTNAARDGHDTAAIDSEAFDEATRRLAAKARSKAKPADNDVDPGLDGTPLGAFMGTGTDAAAR
jgi:hypothetical protein